MERQKHRLNYAESSHGFGFASEKKEYETGENVVVIYNAVMTDTSYSFDINADDVKIDYGSVIRITFTMPDHDVDIKCQSRYVMGYRSEIVCEWSRSLRMLQQLEIIRFHSTFL